MNNQGGGLTAELLIALALFSLLFGQAANLLFEAQNLTTTISLRSEALDLADAGLTTLLKGAQVSSAPVKDVFLPTKEQTFLTPCFSVVKSSVAWQESGRVVSVNATGAVVSLENALAFGKDCAVENITLNKPFEVIVSDKLFSAGNATDLDIIFAYGKTLGFVATQMPEMADLWVFDLSVWPPVLISNLELGPGINSLDAAWNNDRLQIFAASHDESNQFLIIDAHNPYAPFLLDSQTLPGVGNSYPQGWSILYYQNKVYVGTRETAGNELHVYGVSFGNTAVHLQSIEVNHNVNAMAVAANRLFLATSSDHGEIIALDGINSGWLKVVSEINLGGIRQGESDSVSLFALGSQLLVGNTLQKLGDTALALLDVSLDKPVVLAESGMNVKKGERLEKVFLSGERIFVGISGDSGVGLLVGKVDREKKIIMEEEFFVDKVMSVFDVWNDKIFSVSSEGEFICFGCQK